MSDEMVESHVRRRIREGAAHEQIRAELAGMGMDVAAAEKLLAPPKVDEWEAILFWGQLSPLVIVPMIGLLMAVIFPRPQLAVMLVALGVAVYFVAWISMIAQSCRDKNFFWVALMVFTGGFGMFVYFIMNIKKIWKQFLVYVMGVVVSVVGVIVDPQAIVEAFPEQVERHNHRRRHSQQVVPTTTDVCLVRQDRSGQETV